jgi:hypothetical protein
MSESINQFPELPFMIDVGGDRYYLAKDQTAPIDLAYKNRKEFYNTFLKDAPNDTEKRLIERLLRQYMYYSPKLNRKYKFKTELDKRKVIEILKKRVTQLKASNEFTSSLIKNKFFQDTYLRIQEIIRQIEESGLNRTPLTNTESQHLKYLEGLTEDKKFHLLLELSWYLLHAGDIPRDVLKNWVSVVQKQENLRIRDLITNIQAEKVKKPELITFDKPLNYFQRINIGKSAKSNDKYAEAFQMAIQSKDDQAKKALLERLESILTVLKTKQIIQENLERNEYGPVVDTEGIEAKLEKTTVNPLGSSLTTPAVADPDSTPAATTPAATTPVPSSASASAKSTPSSKSRITNLGQRAKQKQNKTSRDSSSTALSTKSERKPDAKALVQMTQPAPSANPEEKQAEPAPAKSEPSKQEVKKKSAMKGKKQQGGALSIFDKKLGIAMNPLFDYFKGMYDPIYTFLETTMKNYSKQNPTINLLPSLLTLLHLCLNIQPAANREGGQPTYGVYRIVHTPPELLSYLRLLILRTEERVNELPNDEEKNLFQEQVFSLPKVRLTTLLNPFVNPKAYKDPDEFPYFQLFTVGDNLTIPPRETFLNASNPKLTEMAYEATEEFFEENDLYLVCTRPSQAREGIPMNVHTVDFNTIDVGENSFSIDVMPDHYFNKKKNDKTPSLEKLVELTPYVCCNDGEVAMSVLIGLKERMPK